jgi:hypothetical protein
MRQGSRKTEKGVIEMTQEAKRKTAKKRLVYCAYCGKPFETTGLRRRFCCAQHREHYFIMQSLKRKAEAGELKDWRVDLLRRLEAIMAKERSKVVAELQCQINKLLEDQKKGGETA